MKLAMIHRLSEVGSEYVRIRYNILFTILYV